MYTVNPLEEDAVYTESEIVTLFESNQAGLYFNDDITAQFSLNQPVMSLVSGNIQMVMSSDIKVGDIVLKLESDKIKGVVIEKITQLDDITTYALHTDDLPNFVAGGYIMNH